MSREEIQRPSESWRKALAPPVAQVYTLTMLVDDYAAWYLRVDREARGAQKCRSNWIRDAMDRTTFEI